MHTFRLQVYARRPAGPLNGSQQAATMVQETVQRWAVAVLQLILLLPQHPSVPAWPKLAATNVTAGEALEGDGTISGISRCERLAPVMLL